MAEREKRNSEEESGGSNVKHGTRIYKGHCRDCAEGMTSPSRDGFEYFDEEGDGRGFWFCCYCGSNHVTLTLESGETIEQGDLY